MVSLKERLQAAADGDFSHFEGGDPDRDSCLRSRGDETMRTSLATLGACGLKQPSHPAIAVRWPLPSRP